MTTPYAIYCYGADGLVRSGTQAGYADENAVLAAASCAMLPGDSHGEVWRAHRRIFILLSTGQGDVHA
jgi:hypothetical protein